MKILWMANAPWVPTGYGTQSRLVVSHLRNAGYAIDYFAFFGLAGGQLNMDGMQVFPVMTDMWGADALPAHVKAAKADVLITLMDVWVQDYFGRKAQQHGFAFCPWLPIDQTPVPQAIIDRLDGAHTVLPYSKFGETELRQAGVNNLRYIPHAVDTHIFKPMNRELCRDEIGIPQDAFVIGMVATNKGYPSRKCLAEQILAFARFKHKHPNALLYMHTMRATTHGGVDLDALLKALDLREGADFIFSLQYSYMLGWPDERIATLYNSFDVLSAASMGEGFGLPILEAQACGVPVITANNTTSPELTFAGLMISDMHPWWTPLNTWAYIPDVDGIEGAYHEIHDLLQSSVTRQELAARARDGARPYDIEVVMRDHWLPFLRTMEATLDPQPSARVSSNNGKALEDIRTLEPLEA